VTCTITIQNNISALGADSSTVTATSCLAAAGVLPPFGCTTTVTTNPTQLVTSVDQCNGIVNGGGSNVTCSVSVTNMVPVGTPTPGVTVNQCIGSGQGGGTQPTVVCNPVSNTTNATVDQCNSSGNGGGASMRVKCTVTGATSATPVTINQCNGSGDGGGSTVTCTTSVTNNYFTAPVPALTVVKTAAPTTVSAVGQILTYSFLVTNTGNVTLTNVNVVDAQTAPAGALASGPTCPSTTILTGNSVTCTASYVVTQADLNNGSINDSAVANGTPPTGPAIQSAASPATVGVTAAPSLTVAKSAAPTTVTAVGQTITYSFLVTNTGNVTLTAITVADTQTAPAGALASGPTCPATTLDPGQTVTCTATYVVTQADLAKGSVADTAVARAHKIVRSKPSTLVVQVTATTPTAAAGGTTGASGGTTGSGTSSSGTSGSGTSGSGTSSGAATSPLAFTGLSLGPLLGVAFAMVLAGTSVLVLARRQRRT
jgi:uncharacterized repeat protein (TIGR01451 family)